MSKLVSEADRLLDKGKVPEAIEKLKAALKEDPLNQLVATKLANAFLANDDQDSATKVYSQLANRLSEAGKAQIAIAIYKQALELSPNDISLKVKFATECEAVGKVGDALGQVSLAFQYYIKRKKFYDAVGILPLMIRLQPKDEKLKLSWIEIMQLSQAEQKLVHLLVCLCGPPGLVSSEFSVGGDPSTLSDAAYEALKRLVPFFPRDPKMAYAVAWAAHKRGKSADFYKFLRECLRREPDFSLALLLFARVLAEKQKLNESLFIFKHMKERMPADKNVDMLTLNRLVDAFVEKNGWISFTDGMGVDELDSQQFLAAIRGEKKVGSGSTVNNQPSGPPAVNPAAPSPDVGFLDSVLATAKAEDAKKSPNSKTGEEDKGSPGLEISLDSSTPAGGELEVEFTSAQAKKSETKSDEANTVDRKELAKELDLSPEDSTNSVLLTSLIGLEPEKPAAKQPEKPEKKESIRAVPEIAEVEPTKPFDSNTIPSQAAEKPKFTFNPFANSEPPKNSGGAASATTPLVGEKTELFSPLDLLGAANVLKQNVANVETKIIVNPQMKDMQAEHLTNSPNSSPAISANEAPQVTQTVSERIQGDPTQLFSPMEAVDAGIASRKSQSNSDDVATKIIVNPSINFERSSNAESPAVQESVSADPTPQSSGEEDLATQLIASLVQEKSSEPNSKIEQPANVAQEMPSLTASEASNFDPLAALANAEGEATVILTGIKPEPAPLTPEPLADASAPPTASNTNQTSEPASSGGPSIAPPAPVVFTAAPEAQPAKENESSFQIASAAEALAELAGIAQFGHSPPQSPTVSVQMNPTVVMNELEKAKAEKAKEVDPNELLATLLNKNIPEVEGTQVVSADQLEAHVSPASSSNDVDVNHASPKPLSLGFVKIPEQNPQAAAGLTVSVHSEDGTSLAQPSPAPASLDGVDLGDDLLEGPTRILVLPKQQEATERLFNEIKRDKKSGVQPEDKIAYMLKKAERYVAKRNFYLARKAFRHALELGANQQMIQEKLREVRKQEMPDSLYLSESTDMGGKVKSEEILRKLEQEFHLDVLEDEESHTDIESDLDHQFENILRENDPKTILDFSVGLYEMGLYRPAENLLQRFIDEHPEYAFDAFYLSAICKFARRDYAGAVSILKKLGADLNKSEREKIQIYYTLGEVFEKMERHESSKEFFDKVAHIDSNYRSIKQKLEK